MFFFVFVILASSVSKGYSIKQWYRYWYRPNAHILLSESEISVKIGIGGTLVCNDINEVTAYPWRYFNNVLGIMFSRLKKLVKWPGRVGMNYKFKCNLEC